MPLGTKVRTRNAAASTIYYFLVSSGLAAAVNRIGPDPAWPGAPRRPISLYLAADFETLHVLRFAPRAPLGTVTPFGPRPKPPCWAAALAAIATAKALCQQGAAPTTVKAALTAATAHVSETAARELAELLDQPLSSHDARAFGATPRLVWQPALRADRKPDSTSAQTARARSL